MIRLQSCYRQLLCALLLMLLAGGAARAAVAVDVAVGMNVNDDARIFLNVTNETWHPPVATTFIQRCPYPEDDFPVISFLAYHSHRSPTFILNLRREGYHWNDIFFQLNVVPSVLFVGIDRDPGPPYGNAWGYWKKNYRPGARMRYRMSDRDIIGLVKVQTASRHFGTSPYRVIEARQQGRGVEAYAAHRWREKHGRERWGEGRSRGGSEARTVGRSGGGGHSERHSEKPDSPDQGKGKGKSSGKGSGKGGKHGKGGRD